MVVQGRWCPHPASMKARRSGAGGSSTSRRFLAAVALLVAGCVSHGPEPLEPAAVLEELRQRTAAPVRHDLAGPGSDTWFPLLQDVRLDDGLTLAEANALALSYAAPIRVARAEARVAGAQVLRAGVLANPQLVVGPRLSSADAGLIFPASLSWELPLYGRRDAEREAATARLGAGELAVIDVEMATLLAVRATFMRLGGLGREEDVLAAAAAASAQLVDWTTGLQHAGEVDAVAVFLARAANDEAHAELESARARIAQTRRDLFSLVGLLPDAPVEPLAGAAPDDLPPLPDQDDDALLRVPAVRVAAARYDAAEATLRLELARQYPDIRLGPAYESDRGESSYGFELGATLPLFDRNQGGIATALEERRLAGERYRSALLDAAHGAAAARGDLAAAVRLLAQVRERAMRDALEASRSLEIRLRAGRAEVLEVLAAQRAITRARVRVIELEGEVAVARLRAAVAGGLALRHPPPPAGKEVEE